MRERKRVPPKKSEFTLTYTLICENAPFATFEAYGDEDAKDIANDLISDDTSFSPGDQIELFCKISTATVPSPTPRVSWKDEQSQDPFLRRRSLRPSSKERAHARFCLLVERHVHGLSEALARTSAER